jgi:hypothetical protein
VKPGWEIKKGGKGDRPLRAKCFQDSPADLPGFLALFRSRLATAFFAAGWLLCYRF